MNGWNLFLFTKMCKLLKDEHGCNLEAYLQAVLGESERHIILKHFDNLFSARLILNML